MNTARDFPYRFVLSKKNDQWKISRWCTEQFGPRWSVVSNRSGVWCCFWIGTRAQEDSGKYEWLFLNERDANWFALRWS